MTRFEPDQPIHAESSKILYGTAHTFSSDIRERKASGNYDGGCLGWAGQYDRAAASSA